MSAVIISDTLKPGVVPAAFEAWVRAVDQPTLRGRARGTAFDTFRVERLLIGEGEPHALCRAVRYSRPRGVHRRVYRGRGDARGHGHRRRLRPSTRIPRCRKIQADPLREAIG
jgi:hypothetical protein